MKFRKSLISVTAAIAISACSSTTPTRPVAQELLQGPIDLTVLFQSNRLAEFEPCGCHYAPNGGLDREFNALNGIKKEGKPTFYLDAGNLFAPFKLTLPPDQQKQKADVFLEAMNREGLDVLALGPTDYALGITALKEMEKKAKFAFVSTNVFLKSDNKRPFAPYKIIKKAGIEFGVLAVSLPSDPFPKNLKVESVESALDEWLPEVKKKSDLVVVLSQLTIAENEALAKRYPDVQLFIGADVESSTIVPSVTKGANIVVDPRERGFYLSRMDLKLKFPFQGFYNEETIKQNQLNLYDWQVTSRTPEGKELGASRRIDEAKETLLAPIVGGSLYSFESIPLDEKRFGQKNEITALIDQYKKSVRNRALME
jgi:2',3'-cyclic-nucleotide 2'-phosphodiesterase (5'-nucleotidase family)